MKSHTAGKTLETSLVCGSKNTLFNLNEALAVNPVKLRNGYKAYVLKNLVMKLYHRTSKSHNLKPGDILLPPIFTQNQRELRSNHLDVVFATCSLVSARKYSKIIPDPVIFEVMFEEQDFQVQRGTEFIGSKARIVREVQVVE